LDESLFTSRTPSVNGGVFGISTTGGVSLKYKNVDYIKIPECYNIFNAANAVSEALVEK
jgi:hypothetical protein